MADTFKLVKVTNPKALQPKIETSAIGTKENVSHDLSLETAQWRKAGGEVIINADGSVNLNEADSTAKYEIYITEA